MLRKMVLGGGVGVCDPMDQCMGATKWARGALIHSYTG